MNYMLNPEEIKRLGVARESYSGSLLSNHQFDDFIAFTDILEREIIRTEKFKEKLSDLSYAAARTDKLDALKTEETIRGLFKARTGMSMNEFRETLIERGEKLSFEDRQRAYHYAKEVGSMIENGNKIAFYRAYSHQAATYADEFGISHKKAKSLMQDAFEVQEGKRLYDWGKEKEAQFYRPQIESEKAERVKKQSQSKAPSQERQYER